MVFNVPYKEAAGHHDLISGRSSTWSMHGGAICENGKFAPWWQWGESDSRCCLTSRHCAKRLRQEWLAGPDCLVGHLPKDIVQSGAGVAKSAAIPFMRQAVVAGAALAKGGSEELGAQLAADLKLYKGISQSAKIGEGD